MNSFMLDGDWHCVRGKDAISYCNGVESMSAHCNREDVLSLVEASQAADGSLQPGDKDGGNHPANNKRVLSSYSNQDQDGF